MQRRVRRSIPYTVIFLSVILYIDRGPHTRLSGVGGGEFGNMACTFVREFVFSFEDI